MATKASRIALAGSNISSTGEVDADLLDNIDSAAFLSLDSNGRLGIGTSSPLGKLHVRDGTAQAGIDHSYIYDASAISIEATEPSLQLMAEDSGTHGGSILWRYGNNTFAAIANPATDTVDFTYGVTTADEFQVHSGTNMSSYLKIMSIGADGNLDVNGLIKGIAGASSSGGIKLHTNSGINVSANVMSFHTGQANGFSFNGNSDGADSSNPLVVIRADGKVGIGTTSPGYKLQVDHGTAAQYASSIRNTADNLQLLLGTTTGGLLNIQGKTISSNAAYQIALNAEGGKVGVGTASPDYPLQISGSNVLSGGGLATLGIYDTGTAYNGTNPGGGITFRGKYNSTGSLTNFATVQGIKENATDGNYDTALRFTTRANGGNLTEKMRIDHDGNVGIGTASPIDKLNVHYTSTETHNTTLTKGTNTQGIWVTNQQNTNNMAGIHLATGGGTHFSSIVGCRTNNNAHWGTHLSFYTHDDNASNLNTANEKMRIHGCGAVTTPQQPIGSFSDSRTTSVSNGILDSSNFYNKTWLNQGNHMNFSNGRFTCPVAGIYRIYFRATGSGNSNVRLRKNGGTINEAYEATGTNHSVSSEAVIPCSAGDYLEIQCSSSNFLTGTQHKQVTFELIS